MGTFEDIVFLSLLSILSILGIAIIRINNLFAVVMLSGMFSLTAACLYISMDAVDVAFTEAAVGGGIATLLFLSTLTLTKTEQLSQDHFSFLKFGIVAVTGVILMFGISDMPHFGEQTAPVQQHLATRYIQESPVEIGIPNMVTSVLASYRGYDTMGEVTVIFTALVSVLGLLGRRRKQGDP